MVCRLVRFFSSSSSRFSPLTTHAKKKKTTEEEEEDERIFGREKIKTLSFRLSPSPCSSSFVFASLGYILLLLEREIERELLKHTFSI